MTNILNSLQHPGIVELYDFYMADDEYHMVMEYLDGATLAALMNECRALSTREILHFAMQLSAALEHIHQAGFIHRDLKPENIVIVRDNANGLRHAKIIDFGIAKSRICEFLEEGVIVGTPGYMAPEQYMGGTSVDERADLYALGCILKKLLASTTSPREANPDIPGRRRRGRDTLVVLLRLQTAQELRGRLSESVRILAVIDA